MSSTASYLVTPTPSSGWVSDLDVIFLDLEDLLHIAERALGAPAEMRDAGLLESAAMRPRATVFGEDAYPDLEGKAAALLQSIVGNHALVDGNKRLGLAALIAFLGVNGKRLTLSNHEAYDLVMAVASGDLRDLDELTERIRVSIERW